MDITTDLIIEKEKKKAVRRRMLLQRKYFMSNYTFKIAIYAPSSFTPFFGVVLSFPLHSGS